MGLDLQTQNYQHAFHQAPVVDQTKSDVDDKPNT